MGKKCPRCKLPIEESNECEHCGLKISRYSHKTKWDTSQEEVNFEPYRPSEAQKMDSFSSKYGISIIIILLAILVVFEGLKLTKTSEALYHSVYDYNIVFLEDKYFKEDMRLMGNEGWEIINARRVLSKDNKTGYECIIKRTRLSKKK